VITGIPLVDVVRSGFIESVHSGHLVVLDAVELGHPNQPLFPRSSNKPLQAVGMRRLGLDVPPQHLALAAASHSGEAAHIAGVRAMLASGGLGEDDLGCPPAWPLDETARRTWPEPLRITMNCSGKHAAMLLTCLVNGWPTKRYLAPDHPLHRSLRAAVEDLAGEPVAAVGVDGCGAPLFALTLAGLARAFRALVLAAPGTPERRVADAMRAHPEWTSGTSRDERKLMDAVPGLLVKGGAEGVDAFALSDGNGVLAGAVKIDDGAHRARTPVTVAALRLLGITVPDELATAPVIGGEAEVGVIRAAGGLA
jgi:L-asparaginase II